MITIDKETVVCDVDDTLIFKAKSLLIHIPSDSFGAKTVDIKCPYTNEVSTYVINSENLNLLEANKKRGYAIILWSAAGRQWSETVAKALHLEDIVDLCLSKPVKYIDDKKAEDILGERVYVNDAFQIMLGITK